MCVCPPTCPYWGQKANTTVNGLPSPSSIFSILFPLTPGYWWMVLDCSVSVLFGLQDPFGCLFRLIFDVRKSMLLWFGAFNYCSWKVDGGSNELERIGRVWFEIIWFVESFIGFVLSDIVYELYIKEVFRLGLFFYLFCLLALADVVVILNLRTRFNH